MNTCFKQRALTQLPIVLLLMSGVCCERGPHPLDETLARSSVEKAMQAWVEGKQPSDLKAEIIVGDPEWEKGTKLTRFEVLKDEETADGSNLYIRVKRTFGSTESKVVYIVGTSPKITIFPQ